MNTKVNLKLKVCICFNVPFKFIVAISYKYAKRTPINYLASS